MAMFMTYRGVFGSSDKNKWEAVISCERDSAPAEIGALSFTGDEPLVIEWPERAKDEPICGSTATLNLLSPGDRTYIDLYSIEVGRVRLDVYRNDVLYWSGMLDPEFYEEPYSMMKDYEVTLTFSDFGILERLKYNLAGFKTLKELVDYAIGRSGIMFTRIDEQYISTMFADGNSPLQLSELSVRSDNFYDEDGEALSLRDVLDGFMRPLGLKMIQRGGVVWIFDLNGLRTAAVSSKVEWMGEDQMLGVDKVFNNVRITWSAYAACHKLLPDGCWTEETDANLKNLRETPQIVGRCQILSYHLSHNLDDWPDSTDAGFTLWISAYGKASNVEINDPRARFFKIIPQNDGSESEGVAVYWTGFNGSHTHTDGDHFLWWELPGSDGWGFHYPNYGLPLSALKSNTLDNPAGGKIFTSGRSWLPPVRQEDNLLLRVTLPMLMDNRFNPFEGAVNLYDTRNAAVKQEDTYNKWQAVGNFIYVPVVIKYKPDDSDDIYVWTNRDCLREVVWQGSHIVPRNYRSLDKPYGLPSPLGKWVLLGPDTEANPTRYGWLCYCDSERDGDKSGVTGWHNNRQALPTRTGDISTMIRKLPDGQYIPYPVIPGHESGGTIWMEVRGGAWIISDGTTRMDIDIEDTGLWTDETISFILFQLPQLKVVRAAMFDMDLDDEDVEYAATLNSAAKEDLEIETICGSRDGGYPMARGAYFLSSNYSQVTRLKRAGRIASIEQLLIGTLFSQYAKRHTKLTGTTKLPGDTLLIYREAMQPQDTRFMLTAAVEDCGEDLCESTVVELSPDEYDKA